MPRDLPEPYTAEMIEAVIATLQSECVRLLAVKEAMKALEIETLPVRSSISLKKKGLPIIISFTQAAVDALRNRQLGG